jgi:hypothetical protein
LVTHNVGAVIHLAMRRPINFNWLIVLIVSWAIPVNWPHSYLFSLTFWVLPIGVLLPDFLAETDSPTGRRRRALLYAALWIAVLGVALDFVFGKRILTFDADWYLWQVFGIPIEEVLFYILAPFAILLVYAWADEHWVKAYNRSTTAQQYMASGTSLLQMSPQVLGVGALLLAGAIAVKSYVVGQLSVPLYATFLIVTAFVPAIAVYRAVGAYVNWRAFGATELYVIGTSLAYEVTLALPLRWWGYQDDATMNIFVERWSAPHSHFPIEAAAVWIAAPFSSVLTYEWIKAYLHHPGQTWRRKLGY